LRLFQFDLALELGHYDPDEMMAGAPLGLLFEWQQYSQLRPFGYLRDSLMTANICLQVVQAAGGKKKGGGDFTLADFMLHFDKAPKSKAASPKVAESFFRKLYGDNRKPGRKPHRKNR